MTEDEVRAVVKETVKELKRNGMLKSFNEIAYAEICITLKNYYDNGERDEQISKAVEKVENDYYFKIIPLYFGYGYTMENIAEYFNVEVTTIARNKKRLCLAIYNAIPTDSYIKELLFGEEQ